MQCNSSAVRLICGHCGPQTAESLRRTEIPGRAPVFGSFLVKNGFPNPNWAAPRPRFQAEFDPKRCISLKIATFIQKYVSVSRITTQTFHSITFILEKNISGCFFPRKSPILGPVSMGPHKNPPAKKRAWPKNTTFCSCCHTKKVECDEKTFQTIY